MISNKQKLEYITRYKAEEVRISKKDFCKKQGISKSQFCKLSKDESIEKLTAANPTNLSMHKVPKV